MKNITNRKKALLLIYSYIIIFFTPKIKSNNQKIITYNDKYNKSDNFIFATYNNKNIYIANELLIELLQEYNPNNIYVIDERYNDNSNMSIYNSYKIINKNDILNILSILMEYEKEYPSEWDRTLDSLTNEWIIHNICYYLNLEIERTEQVDLDNLDEYKYTHYLLSIYKTISNHLKTLPSDMILTRNKN